MPVCSVWTPKTSPHFLSFFAFPPPFVMATQVCTPTCTGIGIRTANDAFVILEAVRKGIYPLRKTRLSQAERDSLSPGQVFVWTESNESSGLERWTDGRKWSASRTRDVFLIYEEREEPSIDESVEKAAQRINHFFSNTQSGSGDLFGIFAFPKDRPPKVDGLMKQTFSAWVLDIPTGHRVKWHLSAYLSRQQPINLRQVSEDPQLARLVVPEGIYECCTGPRKNRRGSRAQSLKQSSPVEPYPRVSSRSTTQDYSPSHPPSIRVSIKSESDWDTSARSSPSLASRSPSTISTAIPTPPRTVSSSSIGSLSPISISNDGDDGHHLPRILGPPSGNTPYYYPPSPVESPLLSSASARPLTAPYPLHSGAVNLDRSPSSLALATPTQEPHPYNPAARAPSVPYSYRSDADVRAVAAFEFRPF